MAGYVDNLVYDDPAALADAAAHFIATVLVDAVRDRGTANLCVAGGTTPRATLETLAANPHGHAIDWLQTDVWFSDERCVPHDHEGSNFRMVDEALLSRVPIPPANVHRVAGDLDPAAAARAYDMELHASFPDVMGESAFDLVLLGVGNDGHVASLFPGSPALKEEQRWAAAVEAPSMSPSVPRVSLTPPIIRRARRILYLVSGITKRAITRRVLLGSETLPAAMFRGRESTLWLMDLDASPAGAER